MRALLLNLAFDEALRSPEELLQEYRTITGWSRGLVAAGAEVIVVQGFHSDTQRELEGITYRFVSGSYSPSLRWWRTPWSALRVVRSFRPDIVHLNGLLFSPIARALRTLLPRSVVLIGQHHAERPFPGWRGRVQRSGLAALDGFIFTGKEIAEEWREARVLLERQPIYEILEGSSSFTIGDRAAARSATGFVGSPICFWAGNLNANKDPITILDGFENLLSDLPAARLYMAFRYHDLLDDVRARIRSSAALSGSVELLGRLSYRELEVRLNASDIFVQGSHYEGSGYALVDALACGVVPAVTDIPPFRFITGGDCGVLWTPGDSDQFRTSVLRIMSQPLGLQSRAARSLFEQRLSFEAIGRQALSAYSKLVELRRTCGGT